MLYCIKLCKPKSVLKSTKVVRDFVLLCYRQEVWNLKGSQTFYALPKDNWCAAAVTEYIHTLSRSNYPKDLFARLTLFYCFYFFKPFNLKKMLEHLGNQASALWPFWLNRLLKISTHFLNVLLLLITLGFWETAHLPLPLANILP